MASNVELSSSDVNFSMSNPHASDRALMKKKDSSNAVNSKPQDGKGRFKFSAEESAEYSEVFDMICSVGDSSNISKKEIGLVMRKLGQNPSDDELKDMIAEVDIDGYGAINKKNFMMLMARKVKNSQGSGDVDINEEAFHVFDHSHCGKLKAADIRKIMTNVGEKLCDEEVEEMLTAVNADPSGITYQAFLELVA